MLYPALEMEAVMGLAEAVVAFEVDIAKLLLPLEQERDPADISVCASKLPCREPYHHLTCAFRPPSNRCRSPRPTLPLRPLTSKRC
jgi:hypothetical protein